MRELKMSNGEVVEVTNEEEAAEALMDVVDPADDEILVVSRNGRLADRASRFLTENFDPDDEEGDAE